MKKIDKLLVFTSTLLMLPSLVGLTSCGKKNNQTTSSSIESATSSEPISSVHSHQAGTDWEYDDTYHWHKCDCGEVMDKAEHIFVDGECKICSYAPEGSKGLQMFLKEDNTYSLVDVGICDDEIIVIPSKYNGLPVTSIGMGAITSDDKVKSIIIPDSVTYISEQAITYNTNLTSITLGNNVEYIGDYAFANNELLTSIKIPDSTKYIGNYILDYCNGITDIILGNNIEFFGNLFSSIKKVENLHYNIFENGKYLGSEENEYLALIGVVDENVETFTINENTQFILKDSLSKCSELVEISIPNSIKMISQNSFTNSTNLVYKEYDNGLYLGNSENEYFAFAGMINENTTSLTVHEKTEIILPSAVTSNKYIEEITLGKNVKQICEKAFQKNQNLKTIYLPDSLRIINSYAFMNCYALEEISLNDDIFYIGEYTFFYCQSLTSVDLPDSLAIVQPYCFNNCEKLESVTFGSKLTDIKRYAFKYTSIKNIDLPDSVRLIDYGAFSLNDKLESIKLGKGIVDISDDAFDSNSVGIIEENNGKYIGDTENPYRILLSMSDCSEIKINENTEIIASYSLSNVYSANEIILPENVKYVSIGGLSNINVQKIVLNKNLEYIGMTSFYFCNKLLEIYNLSSIKIGKYSSSYASNYSLSIFTSLNTPSKINEPDADGFQFYESGDDIYLVGYYGDQNSITLPESYNGKKYKKKNYAFYDCSLNEIVISDGVTSIGYAAFSESSSLSKVIISDSVTLIEEECFSFCTGLKFIVLGAQTQLKDYVFYYCNGLKTVVIRNNNMSICDETFYNCFSLKNIYCWGTASEFAGIEMSKISQYASFTVYYYSENEPSLNEEGTDYDGNYWCYDEDGITPINWVKA